MSSLKDTNTTDGGTATMIGGSDWNTLVSYFKNKLNAFTATINSPTIFKSTKFSLRNASDSASVTINAGNVVTDTTLTTPSFNGNDEITTCNAPQELKSKVFDFNQNTVKNAGIIGDSKWGLIQAPRNANDGTVSQGSLAGHINFGATSTMDNDPPPAGTHWQYETGTTSNTNAGIRWSTAWLRRDFNPRLRVKYRTPIGPTGAQLLIGFSVDTDIAASDAAIQDTQSGVIVGYRSTDTNYVVIRNSGTSTSSATPTVDDTANTATVTKSSTLYRIAEIAFSNQGNDCTVTISKLGTTYPYALTQEFTKTYTTNLPAITSPGTGASIYMRPVFQITNREVVNHYVELFRMEQYSDF